MRHLLDEYEELWRGRIDRMADLIADSKEHASARRRRPKDLHRLTMTIEAEFAEPAGSKNHRPARGV